MRLNLAGLIAFRGMVRALGKPGAPTPLRRVLVQWAAVYRSAMQERFIKFSDGGGDWKPLSRSTLAARRRKKGGRLRSKSGKRRKFKSGSFSLLSKRPRILRDTGILFAALSPRFQGSPGALEQDIPFGIRVGYGGGAEHPGSRKSVATIANWHQTGAGRLPRRTIIVDPPGRTLDKMRILAQRGLNEAARQAGLQ